MRVNRPMATTGFPTAWLLGMIGVLVSSGPLAAQDVGGDPRAGKLVYERHCLRCHGPGGGGDGPQAPELRVPPMNFHGPTVRLKTDEELLQSVEFGVVLSPMHGYRNRLTEQELQDVVAYVRTLARLGR